MASDDPLPGLCGARVKQGEGHCQRSPINGTGRCRLHGGASPGAPEGNQNAVGNSGGGAPEGNANAIRHAGWSDPAKHYDRLVDDARQQVDELVAAYTDRYRDAHGREPDEEEMNQLRELAAMHHQWWCATAVVLEEGLVVEREIEFEAQDGETQTVTTPAVHPAQEACFRLSSRMRSKREELGIR